VSRLADHLGRLLADDAERDERIWALDGDLADSNGAVHFAERHPRRFVQCGIAEQSMVSVAAGMAACGLRPWVFSFAAFLAFRALDQIRVSVAQTGVPVTLVGSHGGGLANRNGKTHAALNDLAVLLTIPNVEVWCPGDRSDVEHCVRAILQGTAPAYIRLPRRPCESFPGSPGPIRTVCNSSPFAIVTTGLATHFALEAAGVLRKRLDIAIHHVAQLKPFPEDALRERLQGAQVVVTIEDHVVFGGLGTLVASLGLEAPVEMIGWPTTWAGASGDDESLRRAHALDPKSLAVRIEAALRRRS